MRGQHWKRSSSDFLESWCHGQVSVSARVREAVEVFSVRVVRQWMGRIQVQPDVGRTTCFEGGCGYEDKHTHTHTHTYTYAIPIRYEDTHTHTHTHTSLAFRYEHTPHPSIQVFDCIMQRATSNRQTHQVRAKMTIGSGSGSASGFTNTQETAKSIKKNNNKNMKKSNIQIP